ncbi:hypothetical protein Tco_0915703 [Tanacetum coccineum]
MIHLSQDLKKRVKKLEKKKKARTPQLKRRLFKVRIESSTDKSLGDLKDASKQRRNIAESDQDEEISFVQEDAETQGSTAEPSTPPTTTTVIEDEDLIIAETLMKMRSEELDEESVKRQKLEDDAEKAELQLCLEIVPRDNEVVNVESLSTKYSIVDWKTHILTKDKMYYEIIRADGSTKFYKIFTAMLDDFDRQDVLDLYRLIKERFETTCLEGYDRLLWGDLITLF